MRISHTNRMAQRTVKFPYNWMKGGKRKLKIGSRSSGKKSFDCCLELASAENRMSCKQNASYFVRLDLGCRWRHCLLSTARSEMDTLSQCGKKRQKRTRNFYWKFTWQNPINLWSDSRLKYVGGTLTYKSERFSPTRVHIHFHSVVAAGSSRVQQKVSIYYWIWLSHICTRSDNIMPFIVRLLVSWIAFCLTFLVVVAKRRWCAGRHSTHWTMKFNTCNNFTSTVILSKCTSTLFQLF